MKIVLLLLLMTTSAFAGNLCYSSSAAEDAALADAATRDALTVQQEVNQAMSTFIATKYGQAVNQAVGTALANMWANLSNARKTNICTQLNVSPCPP